MSDAFTDHGGTISERGYYADMAAFDTGDHAHGVDHVVTRSGTVLVRVDGTYLSKLGREWTDHSQYDETGGVAARGC